MTFDFYALRFHFVARASISFPPRAAANSVRGALGFALRRVACTPECPGFAGGTARDCERRASCAYARIFEPPATVLGPSGLGDRPRPFVLRASHLDGCSLPPGQAFWIGVNFFEQPAPLAEALQRAFAEMGRAGFAHGRADLLRVDCEPVSVPLRMRPAGSRRLRVEFRTPTELKTASGLAARPEFEILFARARDRVSTLRALYGAGPLEIDFHALGERAKAVRMSRCETRRVRVKRRSSRSGKVHAIGGFVGFAEYEGELDEFMPFLEAARWTGVGRQCSWGKGEILPHIIAPATGGPARVGR